MVKSLFRQRRIIFLCIVNRVGRKNNNTYFSIINFSLKLKSFHSNVLQGKPLNFYENTFVETDQNLIITL